MPCAPRSHPASGDRDRDGWPGPRPTRPRPPPQFSSNFTITIFWVRLRVSQKNVCQTHSLSIHLWETKPRWEKAKKKKKKKKKRMLISRGGVRSQPSNYAVYAPECCARRATTKLWQFFKLAVKDENVTVELTTGTLIKYMVLQGCSNELRGHFLEKTLSSITCDEYQEIGSSFQEAHGRSQCSEKEVHSFFGMFGGKKFYDECLENLSWKHNCEVGKAASEWATELCLWKSSF